MGVASRPQRRNQVVLSFAVLSILFLTTCSGFENAFMVGRRVYQALKYGGSGFDDQVKAPCSRRAVMRSRNCIEDEAANDEPKSRIELPQATHFVEKAAESCLNEGCDIQEAMELQEKLSADEGRIWKAIEELQARNGEDHPKVSKEIAILKMSLSRIHSLSNELQSVVGIKTSDFSREFAGYLAFGTKQTGGFLNLRSNHAAYAE
eukprot:TRINITY_DN13972_c0_g2_i1.p1 TRINITY_DN13972_c0_g2~~TRINITY_DN13972_c0_g2_i1.p1  ORF type:complete len:206 (+),score=53.71 TRINITY_DN13972_c0_g2_i1:66-683(+)